MFPKSIRESFASSEIIFNYNSNMMLTSLIKKEYSNNNFADSTVYTISYDDEKRVKRLNKRHTSTQYPVNSYNVTHTYSYNGGTVETRDDKILKRFEVNAKGEISKLTLADIYFDTDESLHNDLFNIEYINDGNGNIVKSILTKGDKEKETIYQYDNKGGIFKSLNVILPQWFLMTELELDPHFSNNMILCIKYDYETGDVKTEASYEYNSKGYPVKIQMDTYDYSLLTSRINYTVEYIQ